jgi:hypothetical protein
MFCREQVAQLRRETKRIHETGAELVIVGNGAPHFAQAFREDLKLTTPLYTDPSLKSYAALGMKRGLGRTLGSLATFRNAARALGAGHRQGAVQGDAWQLGGVLAVRPDGGILYRRLSDAAGDHPPVADVLAVLEQGSES